MKNYLYATALFFVCIFTMNCQRPMSKYGHQRVVLAGTATDTIVLTDKFYVGDTIDFIYTDRPLRFDTLIYEVNPASSLAFLRRELKNPPDELRFSRMDISEIESQTENIFILKAKKSGTAYFTVISRRKGSEKQDERTVWKMEILAK